MDERRLRAALAEVYPDLTPEEGESSRRKCWKLEVVLRSSVDDFYSFIYHFDLKMDQIKNSIHRCTCLCSSCLFFVQMDYLNKFC